VDHFDGFRLGHLENSCLRGKNPRGPAPVPIRRASRRSLETRPSKAIGFRSKSGSGLSKQPLNTTVRLTFI
jgi:hypothetical protein